MACKQLVVFRVFPLLVTTFLVASLFLCPAYAGSKWWERGAEIVESLKQNTKEDNLTATEIGGAFKDALHIGTENVVKQLGRLDGFNADPAIHIPLPKEYNKVKNVLGQIGMSGMLDDLELKLNRGAEVASSKAKKLFWQSIKEMTFDDVMAIYKGPDDSATQYFKRKMSPVLSKEMRPVVAKSLAKVGALQSYDNMMNQYKTIPFVPDIKGDLTGYTVQKGMEGIFYYIAKEEAAIRKDPAKQTTDLLKRVFGRK